MAFFKNLASGKREYLRSHHTIGRRLSTADTCISQPEISKIHAIIEWLDYGWYIRDLSKNGIWVNRKRVPFGEAVRICIGQIIMFSELETSGWLVENLEKPQDLLVPEDELSPLLQLGAYTLLPNDHAPQHALYFKHETASWVQESVIAKRDGSQIFIPLYHKDIVESGPYRWRLYLADIIERTVDRSDRGISLDRLSFTFQMSLDEEIIRLTLTHDHNTFDLGERSHHELLVQLARHRAADHERGIAATEQGWVGKEQLCRELGIEISHLNIYIFRFSKQLSETLGGPIKDIDPIEKRRGQIRFCATTFRVFKGSELTLAITTPEPEQA